jgi:hypothetical protein
MINNDIRLEGRKLFEERKEFGLKKIVYPKQYDAAALHASVDGTANLSMHFGSFPRLFFTATQGQSGKSRATELSCLFVQNPAMVNSSSGAGLIRLLNNPNAPLPCLLVDEAHEYFAPTGNQTIKALLYSYTRGIKRVMAADNRTDWIVQDLFYPVIMNGLINKYHIPGNFLERCIQIKLPKKLSTEEIDDWVFSDMLEEIGDGYRTPRLEWSKQITKDDLKANRNHITKHLNAKGIHSRDVENFRPLCEYAYCSGDDTFDQIVAIAQYFVEHPDMKLTTSEELLRDIHTVFVETEKKFIKSAELCEILREMVDSRWSNYYHRGLHPDHLPKLLGEYGISSIPDRTGSHRGFYAIAFAEDWKRLFGLDIPATA